MFFWKINHEDELWWSDDDNDLLTFIVVVTVVNNEFGYSTYIYSNRKQRQQTLKNFMFTDISRYIRFHNLT